MEGAIDSIVTSLLSLDDLTPLVGEGLGRLDCPVDGCNDAGGMLDVKLKP